MRNKAKSLERLGIAVWMSAFAYNELSYSALGEQLGLMPVSKPVHRVMMGHAMFRVQPGAELTLYYTESDGLSLYQASPTPISGGGELTVLQSIWANPDYVNYFCRITAPKYSRLKMYRYRLDGGSDSPSFQNYFGCEPSWGARGN
jgi:hypothetical protein